MTNTNAPTTLADTPIQLGHYQLLASIGHGGMGLVYRARDTRLERDVAIKCLRRELFEAHYIERFKREALLLAKLNHPNIVQIYDFIETPDQLALVMELVDGNNLQIHLREHIASMSQRLKWLVQISEGLAVAHDAGIIHRDLKTENILINQRSQAKITDLGIAKSQDLNTTLTDHIAGSYCSMSPEQAKGEAINFKSDLFSLGILAYQLLCGAHPFGDTRNKLQVMQRIITETPTNPLQHNPDLPPEAIDLLGQLLSKNPNNRPDNTQWVAAQFEKLKGLVQESATLSDDTQVLNMPLAKSSETSHTQDHPTFETRIATAHAKSIQTNNFSNNRFRLSIALFSVLIIAGVAIWQWQLQKTGDDFIESKIEEEPYSQTREFNKGIEALIQYDSPRSLDAAEKSFNRILAHTPDNAAAVAGLSIVYSYRHAGDFEDPIWLQKADTSAQQALKLNPQLAFTHVALGRVLNLKAERENALAAFERALSFDSSNIFAWRGKILVLRMMQRYDEAIQFAEKGIEKFPQDGRIAVDLGAIYIDQQNYPKAEETFKLSIQRHPDSVEAYAGLNVALIFQSRNEEAMQVLQKGLQIHPSETLYGNLGTALFAKGDYLAAAESFEAAVSPTKGNPKSHLAWANLADTLLWIPGREAEAKNAYQKACELLAPLLERKKNDVTLISRMGLYSARLGDNTKAEPLLAHAIELAPKNANVKFRAGLAYELLGKREAAVTALTNAIELGYPLKLIQAEPDLVNLRRESGKF